MSTDLNGKMMERTEINGKPCLVPADLFSEEWLRSQTKGSKLKITGRKPRNPAHHAKLFAMLRKCVENTEGIWANESMLLQELKHATGLSIERRCVLLDDTMPGHLKVTMRALEELATKMVVDNYINASQYERLLLGAARMIKHLYEQTLTIHIIGSIAFDAMDQDKFNDWYEQAIQILATQVLGVTPDALKAEIEEMIFRDDGWKQPRAKRRGADGDQPEPD